MLDVGSDQWVGVFSAPRHSTQSRARAPRDSRIFPVSRLTICFLCLPAHRLYVDSRLSNACDA